MTSKINRRNFVSTSAVGLGAIAATSSGLASKKHAEKKGPSVVGKPSTDSPETKQIKIQQSEQLTQLVTPVAVGATVSGSNVQSITVSQHGMGEMVLSDSEGQEYCIEICKRDVEDENAAVIAQTENYGLFLRNGGTGDTPTVESMGQAVFTVAAAIRQNEMEQPALDLLSKSEYWKQQA